MACRTRCWPCSSVAASADHSDPIPGKQAAHLEDMHVAMLALSSTVSHCKVFMTVSILMSRAHDHSNHVHGHGRCFSGQADFT